MKRSAIILTGFSSLLLSQFSWANVTPEPSPGCGGLEWEQSTASSINVHRDTGEYIESIPGNSILWVPAESGTYFLVGADGGDWRDWTRSANVFVDKTDSSGCIDPNLLAENGEISVLSATEVEISWDITGVGLFSHVQVWRSIDGEPGTETIIATGSSYYADDLIPGTNYTFATVTCDLYGACGDSVTVFEVKTPEGGTGPFNPALPLAPLELRAEIYSNSALELFWQHNSDFINNEFSYTVWLDEVAIVSDLNGTSLFIDDLAPGITYHFSVTTKKANNQESEVTSVFATTLGTAGSGGNPPPPGGSGNIKVDDTGNISWSDSGWYQVQDAITYATLCEGGNSCQVGAGPYIVINHHTGVRETILVE